MTTFEQAINTRMSECVRRINFTHVSGRSGQHLITTLGMMSDECERAAREMRELISAARHQDAFIQEYKDRFINSGGDPDVLPSIIGVNR